MSVWESAAAVDRAQKWLGDLPAGWAGARLLEVADAWTSNVDKHTVEGQPTVRLCNYVDVYKNDSITDALDFMLASATREQIRKFRIRRDDTLITKDSETADDIGVPAFVEYEADDLICGYHLAIVRPDPRRVIPKFMYWALDSETTARQWGVTAAGVTRVGIRSTDLNKVTIPLPSLDEQSAIADYLDLETARIDALVDKQKEFIGILRERRVAVIEDAVFTGIRGARTLQPIEKWLLPTAENWRTTQLGFVADTVAGYAFPSDRFSTNREHSRLLRGINLKPGYTDWLESVFWDRDRFPVPDAYVLAARDIVLGMDRPFVGSGVRVAVITEGDLPALLLQRVMRIRPKGGGSTRYLAYLLETGSFYAYLEPMFTGVSVPHMSEWQVRKFKMPYPPFGEQYEIADHLDEQTARIDTLIAKAEEHIELAKERRSALITAAVTGQIDVRTARKAS